MKYQRLAALDFYSLQAVQLLGISEIVSLLYIAKKVSVRVAIVLINLKLLHLDLTNSAIPSATKINSAPPCPPRRARRCPAAPRPYRRRATQLAWAQERHCSGSQAKVGNTRGASGLNCGKARIKAIKNGPCTEDQRVVGNAGAVAPRTGRHRGRRETWRWPRPWASVLLSGRPSGPRSGVDGVGAER